MRKSIRMSAKPLAMATAFAAGTTISMIATALPGGDTLGATGVVNESICQQSVNMTIAGGARSVTTGTGTCQLRTLPPTKGFVRTESSPAGSTVADSGAMVNAGGELYEAYVAGERDAAVLLTPNRSLATSRAVSFTPGNDGAAAFDLAASVQPSAGLQSNWLTGTYHIVNRNHNFSIVASGLENSVYESPNPALGERNYTKSMDVTFNGNGTCSINEMNSHSSFQLTKDPLMNAYGEMDVSCFSAPCGQNSGNDYLAMGNVNMGMTSSVPSNEDDWEDTADSNGNGVEAVSCAYTVPAAGKMNVTYTVRFGTLADVPSMTTKTWTVGYNVSSDLRYIVSDGDSSTDAIIDGGNGDQAMKGGLAIGVRVGSPTLTGKTYLFNALDANYATSTPTTGSYENPQTPVYQEEECLTRGSLVLSSGGVCTVDTVSTCTGRNHGGLEETAADAADGTITDAITAFDGAPAATPTCSWSGTPSDLQVSLGVLDQDGNPVTMQYTGAAADNGEAIVLQGIYNVGGPIPDTDNAPLLPQQKYNMLSFLVAQEYQGSLVADADADGLNNLGEFQWAKQIGGAAVRSDMNASGTSDIYMRSDAVDSFSLNLLIEADDRVGANGLGYNSTSFQVVGLSDVDADGDKDVLLVDTAQGIIIAQVIGTGGSWQENILVGYTDGSEIKELTTNMYNGLPGLLFKTPSGLYYTKTIENGSLTNVSAIGEIASFNYVAMADVDGNGDLDLVMLDPSTGNVFAWKRENNVYTTWVLVGGTSGMTIQAVKDVNNDGRADVVARLGNSMYAVLPDNTGGNGTYSNIGGVNADAVILDVEDVDGDGDADLLVSSASLGQVYCMEVENAAVVNYNIILYSTSLIYRGMGVLDAATPNDLGIVWQSAGGDMIFSQMAAAALSSHYYIGSFLPEWIVHME